MSVKFTVDKLDKWNSIVDSMPSAVYEEVNAALHQDAEEFASKLKANVPKESGNLAESIKIKYGAGQGSSVSDKKLTATVSIGDAEHPYAAHLEFGFMDKGLTFEDNPIHVPPHPYFFPLVRVLKKRLKGRLKRAMKKGINRYLSEKIDEGGDEQ